ncbi:MAG TPA: hypothetical protein VKS44_02940 [Candidatus Acidoferrales bacterium]|nr:hypothetical protein [Candidatus Acidoferrales bacterium]
MVPRSRFSKLFPGTAFDPAYPFAEIPDAPALSLPLVEASVVFGLSPGVAVAGAGTSLPDSSEAVGLSLPVPTGAHSLEFLQDLLILLRR